MTDTAAPRAAVITGGTRGIGLAIARRLAADGWALTLTGRDAAGLAAATAALDTPHPVVQVVADLAEDDAPTAILDAHAAAGRALDALVLNAGMGHGSRIADTPLRRLDRHYAINLRSSFALVSAAIPALRAAASADHAARVIALSSMAAVIAEEGLAAYGATKAAVVSLCDTLNAEESEGGVLATSICPGYVDTDMSAWKHGELAAGEMIRPDDVAELVGAVLRMSRHAVVPRLVVSRPGDGLHGA
ncbi:SDR family oxidoreductase [Microbacterium hominis]|uniref:SDR family oxidoreductase n=1 Tax=Microbacterium hominis TaxID=162426 RepID=A0A7D4UJ39_9MICO|nr:SDR family oxidoreductase [Microbacterium hominis]QKJ20708.1 SDR family oxidoreductase [Microbacterium hominis]